MVKNLPAMQEAWVRSLGWEDPLEKGKAIHASILAWRIPFMGLQRVRVIFTFVLSSYGGTRENSGKGLAVGRI